MPDTASFGPDPERLAALAEFAAGAGHEINNPLATIVGRAGQLLRDESDPQRRHSLSVIAAQAYRIRDMIGDVMAFARPPAIQPQRVDLAKLVREVIESSRASMVGDQPEILLEAPQTLMVSLDPAQWAVVIGELIRNAVEALLSNGDVIRVVLSSDVSCCRLQVIDSGRGFTELERQHAFDPFFSGRQAGRGLGFGLCKVWQIVRLHGGEIVIQSAGHQTTIMVTLAIAQQSPAPSP